MQIAAGGGGVRRDPRYKFPDIKRARIEAETQGDGGGSNKGLGIDLDATVEDISLSGVALRSAAQVETDQFVQLHIDGMAPIAGNVVRAYNGLIAVQFNKDEAARQRLDREVQRLNKVA